MSSLRSCRNRFGVSLSSSSERTSRYPVDCKSGAPVLRLANIEAPLLIAHGEQDIRVHPKQSEELVAELRRLGGKTFEYVTYTTEGHGLLRFEPQVDFYRRLERFFDWYLM